MSGRHSARSLLCATLAGYLCTSCQPSAFDELSRDVGKKPADGGMDAGEEHDADAERDAGDEDDADANMDAASEMDAGPSCGDTTSDPDHCGDCATRCAPPDDGFVSCQRSACREHRLQLTPTQTGALRGGTGGNAFDALQSCANGQVMIGLSGKADAAIVYGLAVHCASLKIAPSAAGYTVSVVPTTKGPELGGLIDPTPPPYELICPKDSVVAAVEGATWLWPGTTTRSIRQLSLSCARVSVDAERKIVLERAKDVLTVGDRDDTTVEAFSDVCGESGAVAGLNGRSGAYIDAVAVRCGVLELQERGGKTETRDD